ncbi:MAG: O-antigen ligase family protein [Anaerolineales bacterium]
MTNLVWERIQRTLVHRNRLVRALAVLAICFVAGGLTGAVIGSLGGILGSATLIALAVGYFMLRSVFTGLLVLVGIICLLPFAAVPINIGFSPTFLDLVLFGIFFVWLSKLVTEKDQDFVAHSPTLPMIVFVLLAVVSFIAGLGHATLTPNVLRRFVEIILSILLFLVTINVVRDKERLQIIVGALILAGFLAALAGIVLYVLPDNLTVRLLSTLHIVRYPTGSQVLRYIEDNPDLPLRATSTSIDPNVLGGMLIFTGTLTAAQALARRPLLPRGWLIFMLFIIVTCMGLTFSRGSFVGLGVAFMLLGLLRYRRMLWIGLAILGCLLLLPSAQVYVQHFAEGIQGEDLSTQMRFGEYKDALILILRYPWLGVGFAGTPDIDTYLGVSSVYLLIAEEMGFLGLAAFLSVLIMFVVRFLRTFPLCSRDWELDPLLLGTCLAVSGAMVAGLVDHYLFNLDFPHASALLWLMLGLGTVSIELVREKRARVES